MPVHSAQTSRIKNVGPAFQRPPQRQCDPALVGYFVDLYCTPNRPTVRACYKELVLAVDRLNHERASVGESLLSIPCLRSFYRRVKALPSERVRISRFHKVPRVRRANGVA